MNIETGNCSSRVFIFFFFYLRVNFVAQYNNLSNELSILYRLDIYFFFQCYWKRNVISLKILT